MGRARWVLGATGWGVLPCRILFRYPRRLRIGSRRQGRGRGQFVDCDSFVRARESACLSKCQLGCASVTVMSSQLSSGKKTRNGSSLNFQSHTQNGGASLAVGVLQRRNSLTTTMSPCVSPSPTGSPIPLPRSWPWSRPSSWARVGQAKTFPGGLGSTN